MASRFGMINPRLVHRAHRAAFALWPWAVPIAVLAFIYKTGDRFLPRLIAGLLAIAVVLLASRRPDRSIFALIVLLPFQGLVLAQLYAWGAPAGLVRPLSSWKEALGFGIVIAGVQGYRAGRRRFDAIDRLGFAYVVLVSVYALAPKVFATGAPAAANARSLAFRQTAGFVILLLAARHARLPDDFASRAARLVLAVGAVVAGIAVYEYFFSSSWNSFIVDNVKYIRYQIDVLHTAPFSVTDIRRYGDVAGHHVVRVGSVFLDPTPCGFFLLLPFAVAVERRLRPGLRGSANLLLIPIAAALVLTQTRSALIGALVITALAIRPVAGRTVSRRFQFALLFAAAIVVAFPAVSATGLTERVSTTASGQNQSSIDHVQSFWKAVDAVEAQPLGHGLGTGAGVGQRFDRTATPVVAENSYLQVGIETGVIAMLLFAALTVAVVRRLRLAAAAGDLGTVAIRSAAWGLAIGAFLLHAWNDFSVAWTFWALAGAAIGISERLRSPGPARAPERRGLSASATRP